MKEAIFFCIVGLPLFGKEGSGTPVFKLLVRALGQVITLPRLEYGSVIKHFDFNAFLPIMILLRLLLGVTSI